MIYHGVCELQIDSLNRFNGFYQLMGIAPSDQSIFIAQRCCKIFSRHNGAKQAQSTQRKKMMINLFNIYSVIASLSKVLIVEIPNPTLVSAAP